MTLGSERLSIGSIVEPGSPRSAGTDRLSGQFYADRNSEIIDEDTLPAPISEFAYGFEAGQYVLFLPNADHWSDLVT
eukprot:5234569-Prymnesium_polylepis.1